jgi:hypothetical protein
MGCGFAAQKEPPSPHRCRPSIRKAFCRARGYGGIFCLPVAFVCIREIRGSMVQRQLVGSEPMGFFLTTNSRQISTNGKPKRCQSLIVDICRPISAGVTRPCRKIGPRCERESTAAAASGSLSLRLVEPTARRAHRPPVEGAGVPS